MIRSIVDSIHNIIIRLIKISAILFCCMIQVVLFMAKAVFLIFVFVFKIVLEVMKIAEHN